MPRRAVAVVQAKRGPIRLVDTVEKIAHSLGLIPILDRLTPAEAHQLNQSCYPDGGAQWDPVTRTYFDWQGRTGLAHRPDQLAALRGAAGVVSVGWRLSLRLPGR